MVVKELLEAQMIPLSKQRGFFLNLLIINFKTVLALRMAFVLRMLFMIANNLIFFVSWYILFNKFGTIRGWSIEHITLMYGITNIAFGIGTTFLYGLENIARLIDSGDLDPLIVRPKPTLLSIAGTHTDPSGLGDIISGIILIYFSGYLELSNLMYLSFILICSVVLFSSIYIFFGSMAFWFKDMHRWNQEIFESVIMFATNPNNIYQGVLRFVMFSLIPVAYVSYLPIQYFITGDQLYLLKILMGTAACLIASLFAFKQGLKRYESGNRVGIKLF